MLAALLQAEGYSVWWDTSLVSGEDFRKVIMTELGRARAAIVIWTESSVASDWVLSEAGRAHADRKLIPLKTRTLTYRDIPPPFDNMHIEKLDDREKIVAAVVAQLAKPEVQASRVSRAFGSTKLELLSWIGIIGAAITLVTNLRGILTLAEWMRVLMTRWAELAHAVWSRVLFFLPDIPQGDAVMLTLLSFLSAAFVASLRKQQPTRRSMRRTIGVSMSLIYALLVILLLVFNTQDTRTLYTDKIYAAIPGVSYIIENAISGPSMKVFLDSLIDWMAEIAGDSFVLRILLGVPIAALVGLGAVLFALPIMLLPVLPFWLLILLGARRAGYRLSLGALSMRLWRILAAVAVIFGFNSLSLWLAAQPWVADLMY